MITFLSTNIFDVNGLGPIRSLSGVMQMGDVCVLCGVLAFCALWNEGRPIQSGG